MLEKFLTVPEGEFKTYLRDTPQEDAGNEHDTRREAYRYALSDCFVMRSQLDCVDPRLPSTGVFDIKTRAAVPIRMDVLNYEENSGYLIKTLTGQLESFEREYYDLIRSAFLKYSFQVRIGNMDGIFVAYHNTARIFGFQYISLEEMEARLYGPVNGARIFEMCLSLLEKILGEVVKVYGQRNGTKKQEGERCPVTRFDVNVASYLYGGAEPVSWVDAVSDDRPWLLHWTMSHSAMSDDQVRSSLEKARSRQGAGMSFPAGVNSLEEMEKKWNDMDFGRKYSGGEAKEDAEVGAGVDRAGGRGEGEDGHMGASSGTVEGGYELKGEIAAASPQSLPRPSDP
ncbi:mitochondrial protein Pet127-domain-containing protein [Melanogaster broomeanus]|nr:mitochondrial protein Pet127-domain-containing protein [Melanogaster broomeanus]